MRRKNIIYLFCVFCIVSLSIFFYKKDNQFFEKILFKNLIYVKDIEITGYNNLSVVDIENYFVNENLKNRNLFFVKPWHIQQKIIANPLIYNAEVRKQYPDKLLINIEEKEPILLLLDNKKHYIFDAHGKITEIDSDFLEKYSIFNTLLKAEGDGLVQEASEISKIFVQKEFTKRISGLYKIGKRRFDMIVDRRIKVMLPEKINEDFVVDAFNLVDKLKANNDIHRDAIYSIVDLRINKRIFVKNISE